jgi:hypothetical protein
MSTERSPAGRGIKHSIAREQAIPQPRHPGDPPPPQNKKPKGSTKTVSRRESFKRKRGR